MKAEVISFRYDLTWDWGTIALKERMKADGVVKQVNIRFYPGCELELEIKPLILHKGNRAEELFTYAGTTKQFINGDNDFFQFPVNVNFEYDDEFVVYAVNRNTTYAYTVCVDVFVEYDQAGDGE